MSQNKDFPKKLHLLLVKIIITFLLVLGVRHTSSQNTDDVRGTGEFILGGLFPIHQASEKSEFECGKEIDLWGFEASHAMLYAIDKLNEDDKILPNITLKARIFDTCRSSYIGARLTKEFIKMRIETSGTRLAGVIGAAGSDVSAKVANILQVFEIPQISYASTSVLLSNKNDYAYFLRTVPPDSFQAQALVDICIKYQWTYVMTVNSEGIYGTIGIEEFVEIARPRGICTDHITSIKVLTKERDYDDIVEKIVDRSKETSVSVVVLFCGNRDTREITRAVQRNRRARKFTWLASDGWDVTNLNPNDTNVITVQPDKGEESKGFTQYFKSLNIQDQRRSNDTNLQQFWEQIFKCGLTNASTLPRCTGNESLLDANFEVLPYHSVTNAVYAFAHALDSLQKELCPNQTGMCQAMSALEGKQLLDHLKMVSFQDLWNYSITFNENGELNGFYDIINFQHVNSEKKYVHVGTWKSRRDNDISNESLDLKLHMVKWHREHPAAPKSYCSDDCRFGYIRQLRTGYNFTCCWKCLACDRLQIIVNNSCQSGPLGYVPDPSRTKWVKREVKYLKWDNEVSTLLVAISSFSVVLTIITFIVYFLYRNDRKVKASGKEVSYIILTGILLCLVTPFTYIAKPTDAICYTRKSSLGIALAMIYSALFMKLNRVYRVFKGAERSIRRPALVRPKSQIFVTTGLVSIHVLFITLWFIVEPTHATETYINDTEELILECHIDHLNFLGCHAYVIVLMVLCTVYAFKTRRFPKNFNESKYIGITLYTTCVVSTVFFAFYLNTKDILTGDLIIAGYSISLGIITLLGLFAQRIFLMVFVEETGSKQRMKISQTRTITMGDTSTQSKTKQKRKISPIVAIETETVKSHKRSVSF